MHVQCFQARHPAPHGKQLHLLECLYIVPLPLVSTESTHIHCYLTPHYVTEVVSYMCNSYMLMTRSLFHPTVLWPLKWFFKKTRAPEVSFLAIYKGLWVYDPCIWTYVQQYNITQDSFTSLKTPMLNLFKRPLPPQIPGNHIMDLPSLWVWFFHKVLDVTMQYAAFQTGFFHLPAWVWYSYVSLRGLAAYSFFCRWKAFRSMDVAQFSNRSTYWRTSCLLRVSLFLL